MKLSVIVNESGEKLYPVCLWGKNQHKLRNAYVKSQNNLWEAFENGTKEDYDKALKDDKWITHLSEVFDHGIKVKGIVYATYKEGRAIKEIIAKYDATHKY